MSSTDKRRRRKNVCLALSLICLGVSVRKMDELASEALIFDLAPCNAGKNDECMSAGFG